MRKLSIVIPAYNEEGSLGSVISDVKKVMEKINFPYEQIVVNDGSTDNTRNLVENQRDIILINHPYKKGYGASLKDGVKRAEGDFVLFIDGDGQQDPEDILKLIGYTNEYDMVVGARENVTSLSRNLAKKILALFGDYLVESKIPDLNSGFRIVKKELVKNYFHLLPDTFSFSATLNLACLKDGVNVKFLPIKERKRKFGKSKINPIKDFVRFLMLILRLAVLFSPFRVFLPISLILFLIGSGYTVFSIIKFFDIPDSGIFLILSSIIIFFFGLIADQISYIRRKIR